MNFTFMLIEYFNIGILLLQKKSLKSVSPYRNGCLRKMSIPAFEQAFVRFTII